MSIATTSPPASAADRARFVRDQLPEGGLFAGHDWRISPAPFPLGEPLANDLEKLGRVLLQFYRAANLLYRRSAEGKQAAWIADVLDRGKHSSLIDLQRNAALKNEVPRVIRPDLLLTEHGLSVTELDSVPGGIGLTAWLGQAYSLASSKFNVQSSKPEEAMPPVIGGADGMLKGFASIFGDAPKVHVVVSEEAGTYRPEMQWLCSQLGNERFQVRDASFADFAPGDGVYRFFELFDLANVPSSKAIFDLAAAKQIRLTPPPKPALEEKMLFALLWNRNLREFWRQELGAAFFERMQKLVPYTWLIDPAPLPPHAAYPEINLTDWQQLKTLSQRERDLILKVSGHSELAWGARGVHLGSDLSQADWSVAVDKAIESFGTSPYILQRYHKTKLVESNWFDFTQNQLAPMPARVRLCPYYFVTGDGDAARANLGGVLATICPADKKIIHGMKDAILAPCSA